MLIPIPGHGGLECQVKVSGLHSVGSRQPLEVFEEGSDAELY